MTGTCTNIVPKKVGVGIIGRKGDDRDHVTFR